MPTFGPDCEKEATAHGTSATIADPFAFITRLPAADFAAIAAFHKRATFIGEETGGVAEGNNGGVEIGVTLPASQLHLQIPTYMYVNPVNKGDLRRRGTIPEYAVTQTIDYLARGRDTVIEFTRELIRRGKGR